MLFSVWSMTSTDCLTKVCESPDIACPSCGSMVSIWVWKDMPLYRCDGCNGIGFRIDDQILAQNTIRSKAVPGKLDCPGCGGTMSSFRVGTWDLDTCQGCSWVFARIDGTDEEVVETKGSRYTVLLNWIGSMYESVLSKM